MSDRFENDENDELLKRLRGEDPAADATEEPGEREAARSQAMEMLASDSPRTRSRITRPRLAVAAAIVVLGIGAILALTLGGSSSGSAPALAIEKTPKWVTLTLKDPNASEAEMNQELADAGIDRVRVNSVPGSPRAVGTWAGYVEIGLNCQGGLTRYGYDVDIPTVKNFNRNTKHGAEGQFGLTVPRRTGKVTAQEVGTPGSKSVVRLPTDSIDDPRNALKILIPVRPRSPDDAPDANQIGVDRVIGLGGMFAQYGDAIQSGQGSCGDFGLKPFPKPTFPPEGNGWVVLRVAGTDAAAGRMTHELKAGHINGVARAVPGTPDEVGQYMGFERVPPVPKHYHGAGNRIDIAPNPVPHVHGPQANDIALRRSAFNAYPNARWVFYVGRAPGAGESPKVLGLDGLVDADAALKRGCPGLSMTITTKGQKSCGGSISLQVPVPPRDSK